MMMLGISLKTLSNFVNEILHNKSKFDDFGIFTFLRWIQNMTPLRWSQGEDLSTVEPVTYREQTACLLSKQQTRDNGNMPKLKFILNSNAPLGL